MKKYFCDRCKDETEKKEMIDIGMSEAGSKYVKLEWTLCNICAEKVEEMLNDN